MKKHLFLMLCLFNVISAFGQFENVLIPYRLKNLWGYCDINGIIKIQPAFDSAELFNRYGHAIVKQNGKFGIINNTGKYNCVPKYKRIINLDNYFSKYFEIEDFAGIKYSINSFGQKISNNDLILERNSREENFIEDSPMQEEGSYEFYEIRIDDLESEELKQKYEGHSYFKLNGDTFILCMNKENKVGLLNTDFEEIVPVEFDGFDVRYGLFKVSKGYYNDSEGLYNLKGQEILPPNFKIRWKFGSNLLLNSENKRGVFSLKKSKISIPVKYAEIAYVKNGNDYNYLVCDSIENFRLIDANNQIISDTIFITPSIPFRDSNYFIAKTAGGWSLYNELGEKIFNDYYDQLIETYTQSFNPLSIFSKTYNYNLTLTPIDGVNRGLISTKNQILVPLIYKYIYVLENTPFAFVRLHNGKAGYLNYETGLTYFKD